MKPRILTTLLICSATLATTVTPAVAAVTTTNATQAAQLQAPENDVRSTAVADLGIRGNDFKDIKNYGAWVKTGNPTVKADTSMNGKIIKFDGHSAYYKTLTDKQINNLKNGLTIEAYFKYDPAANTNGSEHEIFSSQEKGGFGLGVKDGRIIFFAHDGAGYKEPSAKLEFGKWIHAVGVIDKNKQASLYINGTKVDSKDMPGDLKFAQGTKSLVLGGDAAINPADSTKPAVSSQMTGKIKSARLYDKTLTDDQIAQLSNNVQKDFHAETPIDKTIRAKLVGPKQIAAGATYGFNVQASQLTDEDAKSMSFDVVFNPDLFEYVDADRTMAGKNTAVKAVENEPGRVRITTSADLSDSDFMYYAKTRLAHINLRAKANASGKTAIQFQSTNGSEKVDLVSPLNVDIQAKNSLDYNGDGIIGAGDIALAPKDKKSDVAAKAEIKPYKHVIVLTTDGGSNPWDPSGIFYAEGSDATTKTPKWTDDPNIMSKRTNQYTMDLFNNKFAMSTTANSVKPSISAQNYISMLHGRPWGSLPKEYQGINGTMGQQYFAGFGKETPLFPSVFKVLQQNNPNQQAAAFSEWGPIVNSIVEPDAAAKTKQSSKLKSFDDVADYIGTDDFKNTSLVYMQSDYMDGQGHGHGWFNDNYWAQYKQYDGLFKKVMDKLESTGHLHDTLVIANSDHGGDGKSHGQNYEIQNRNIFIALGGETIDSGRRLNGGSNADISALILKALQVEEPSSYQAKVFDKSAFLSQTELAKKQRNVETVKLTQHGKTAKINLTNLKKQRTINTVDMMIDLNGRSINKVTALKGVKILRQKVENGQLKLTVCFDVVPTTSLATIELKKGNQAEISVQQAMASTNDGKEILVDLANNDKFIDVNKVISLHGLGKNKTVTLYSSDLKKVGHRSLLSGTDWRCDKVMIKNGVKYYRVSSNEWVHENDAYEFDNVTKVLNTPKDKITTLVNSNGEKITTRGLAPNTKWATDRTVTIKGKLYYRVSTNEFVASDEVSFD
ncbi:LamG-like jellyroll fold domain-containing protein [Companilactobacillus furfuricola]|uniref:LamG-like jellyroll fold domain-containing protein n=1 Tax=Companilactobacillus furfuricola TaxID=1462575 RepID=UPI000F7B1454|nr:LamG-like jellyroll fold domain-containing protein [Companilactobacillus furfuricola]